MDVGSAQRSGGLYALDTFQPTEALSVTLSGRYQYTGIALDDRTGAPENADLDGRHAYRRFSAALGAAWALSEGLSLFGGWSQSFRAPTAMELACADPDDPCSLPNSFVADPPLDPVRGDTWEAGARGTLAWGDETRWSFAF